MKLYRKWIFYLMLLLLPMLAQAETVTKAATYAPSEYEGPAYIEGQLLYDYAKLLSEHERLYINSVQQHLLIEEGYRLFVVTLKGIRHFDLGVYPANTLFSLWPLRADNPLRKRPGPRDVVMVYSADTRHSTTAMSNTLQYRQQDALHAFKFRSSLQDIDTHYSHGERVIKDVDQLVNRATDNSIWPEMERPLHGYEKAALTSMLMGVVMLVLAFATQDKQQRKIMLKTGAALIILPVAIVVLFFYLLGKFSPRRNRCDCDYD
ncbi:MAG: hypothetical protein OIF57_13715 [Marinobacterium sp.]|nr:hypothetical protein [Marinobacterium sp.]